MARILALSVLLVFAGCASARHEYVTEERFDPRPEDWPIAVLDDISDAHRPFLKVARIYGSGAERASWEKVELMLKIEARKVGADAIVLRGEGTEEVFHASDGSIVRGKKKEALAIRWTDK